LKTKHKTELYEQAIEYEKGSFITSTGALATLSGAKTGRSPRDKRVVKDKVAAQEVWWGQVSALSALLATITISPVPPLLLSS
jgi:ATP-dependent phosphoenolpyruvate carboxykinase